MLRRPRRTALMAVGALIVAGLTSIASPAQAAVACQVTYQKAWDNGSGFGANLTINNLGDPLTSWTLTFAFPGNQQASQGWSGNWSQSGQNVTVTSMSWNGNVPTNGSVGIGFNGSYSGANVDPTVFAINGVTCNGGPSQALIVNPTALTVPEGGMNTYAVRLQAAPSGNVTVTSTAGSGDPNVAVSAGGTLTFTTANWNVTQNVTLSASEDADTTNGTQTITVASTGLTSVAVTATEADNDNAQSLIVAPTNVSVPEGANATYAVRLQVQPAANVTVTSTAGAGDANLQIVGGGTLTFTPANWSVTQNVTLNAAEDADTTNGTRTFTVSSAGLTSVTVTATEADNDSPQSLQVTPTAVTVPEGSTATFTVRLAVAPSASVNVTITAGAGDTSITVSSGASLTFTAANWNIPQTVTLAAAEDADTTNGSRTFAVASAGLTSVSVTATEADNDSPQALIVTPTAVNVPEGSTAVYAVRLASQPTANVTVTNTAGTGDTNITVTGGATLTFTAANWNTNQNVTLAAAQDADSANGTRPITVASTGLTSVTVTATEVDDEATQNSYITEFTTQYDKLKNPANGYFSPEGIPYHSIETLIVEAPDHGHETTSEAFSFWIWLEAQYGRVTGNWTPFNNSWNITEQYIIPSAAGQPGQTTYNPNDPADYAPEFLQPSQYPVALSTSVVAGQDPLANELQSTYGNRNIYGMHWMLDVDDVYGFGTGRTGAECGDSTQRVTYINTFQRGPQESTWETVAHPSCETGRFGQSGSGFPPLFIQGGGANQWRYTNAPDADGRAVEATYWALQWATAQGNQSQISASLTKAARMGDFLRYAMYDKYFKNPGCTSTGCTPGTGKSSSNYLFNWYYSWGGDIGGQWSWRIGASHNHQGYQNPLAAYVLSSAGPAALRPLSSTAATDWGNSLTRQLDFYLWLQSAEGAIAGGATNSWNGNYQAPPAGTPTFYGLAYDVKPVYHDPPSNQWFGFQAWSLHRVAEYYYVTGNAKAKTILDRWVPWAVQNTTLGTGSTFTIPSDMTWSGAPSASYSGGGSGPATNPGLHVTVTKSGNDVGVAAAYARTLTYYAAREGSTSLGTQAKNTAKGLLDRMIALKASDPTGKGIVVTETREDYNRFDDVWNSSSQTGLYIPPGFNGVMPSGAQINSSSTFGSIRPFYNSDPAWAPVQAYMNGTGPAPSFQYHRFWAQADIAMAFADYGSLFPAG